MAPGLGGGFPLPIPVPLPITNWCAAVPDFTADPTAYLVRCAGQLELHHVGTEFLAQLLFLLALVVCAGALAVAISIAVRH